SRRLESLVAATAGLLEQNLGDVELCLALCALLEVDAHPDDVAAMFNPPPEAGVALKKPVSESQPLIAGRYEMSADGTEVLDHQTGLIWQRAIAKNLTHKQALEHAERVAQATGLAWRLPTQGELASLVDDSRHDPASGFPDMPSEAFWSSSPNANGAWYVYFDDGDVLYNSRNVRFAVRLVRGG
ncbi:MAG: hypothetical protein RLZZ226_2077, partial [Pseudomonadota bacterium]